MNRPFFAFGSLLAALALAMLAVSSSSRSTSIGSASLALPGNSKPVAARPAARFCGIVVVLPAADDVEQLADCTAAAGQDSYAAGGDLECPDDVVCPAVRIAPKAWYCRDFCQQPFRPEARSALVVELARHDPALLRDETSRNCRSHHDPDYDRVVYGELDQPAAIGFTSSAGKQSATGNSAPVGWTDYALLLDEVLATRDHGPGPAESTISVRSSSLMLDFAAAGLRQVGQLLQSAADEMKRTALQSTSQHFAGEDSANHR